VNNISIRKMRILLATAEEGNFTRAAMRENISQPAATIIINEIEETFKEELFVRQGSVRKAELTARGRVVAETFSRIVAGYDMELARINSGHRNRRTVKRILVQSLFFDAIDPDWLFGLADLLSGERLVLEEGPRDQIIERIMARDADVGFVEGPVDNKRCDIRSLTSGVVGLAVPPGVAVPVEPSGSIGWNAVPEECYVFGGVADATLRAINRNLNAVGRSLDDMHMLNGLSALHLAIQLRPLPVILPDVLARRPEQRLGFTFHEFSPTSVQCQFSIIAPWGYMNQINLNALRGQSCFGRTGDDGRAFR
jgi:DNA-binding transcriptional LysR family regulator